MINFTEGLNAPTQKNIINKYYKHILKTHLTFKTIHEIKQNKN